GPGRARLRRLRAAGGGAERDAEDRERADVLGLAHVRERDDDVRPLDVEQHGGRGLRAAVGADVLVDHRAEGGDGHGPDEMDGRSAVAHDGRAERRRGGRAQGAEGGARGADGEAARRRVAGRLVHVDVLPSNLDGDVVRQDGGQDQKAGGGKGEDDGSGVHGSNSWSISVVPSRVTVRWFGLAVTHEGPTQATIGSSLMHTGGVPVAPGGQPVAAALGVMAPNAAIATRATATSGAVLSLRFLLIRLISMKARVDAGGSGRREAPQGADDSGRALSAVGAARPRAQRRDNISLKQGRCGGKL